MKKPVSPKVCFCCPLIGALGDQKTVEGVVDDEEVVDNKFAVLGEPIIGIERVVYDDATGPGALPARPLTSPRSMSAA